VPDIVAVVVASAEPELARLTDARELAAAEPVEVVVAVTDPLLPPPIDGETAVLALIERLAAALVVARSLAEALGVDELDAVTPCTLPLDRADTALVTLGDALRLIATVAVAVELSRAVAFELLVEVSVTLLDPLTLADEVSAAAADVLADAMALAETVPLSTLLSDALLDAVPTI
jgi:hypothetical protein